MYRALQQMTKATVIDEKVLNDCLNEITRALLKADVNLELVKIMTMNIKKIVNLDKLADGHDKRKIIQHAIFDELCKMLDTGKPSFTPKKGKPSVVMFVGLQGPGKTTSCTKYASYYQKKGWKPALVCADTFLAGAFDQLKQNATKAKIPFYGRNENCDLIIIDTSGRHQQEASLFEEMRQLKEATQPDLVIFVMDSSIGQAAFIQAQAFNRKCSSCAVTATKSPVIFLGTGEHVHEFEVFDVKPFVSRLLGMGDMSGFLNKIQEVMPSEEHQLELFQKIAEGTFTLAMMREQYQNVLNVGPLSEFYSMLPGLNAAKIKRYMTIMDSMTNEELDSKDPNNLIKESRIMRIARGSGRSMQDVKDMFDDYKRSAKIMKGMKISSRGMNAQQLSQMVPPQMLRQMGGLQNLMRQMGSSKDMKGMLKGKRK
ncbi:hypothetical protein MKW98_020791 [Papaver atlanticum]|uniref:signal-recognition-particle GTPase n=1 Tax=Papaver atlanticum TaxID=357466 RepID=A0AAD4XXJ5_9MAGN|nr:hypothetical protein MKW98_020791 [Papaver atlanticum]